MHEFRVFLLAATALLAADVHSVSARDFCAKSAQVAEALMGARQRGVPLQQSMEAMTSSYPKSARPLITKLVMDAYSVPRYDSAEYQGHAIDDFRDDVHLKCLRASK